MLNILSRDQAQIFGLSFLGMMMIPAWLKLSVIIESFLINPHWLKMGILSILISDL